MDVTARPQGPPEEVRLVRELAHGRWKAEVLRVLLDAGVPDHLTDRPVSAAALAEDLALDADALRRVLDLAAVLGLAGRDGDGRYLANAVTAALRSDQPGPLLGDTRHALSDWGRVAWAGLGHALRHGTSGFEAATGTTVFAHLRDHPGEAAVFHARQASATAANGAALAATDLVPDAGTVVDVGGGTGTLARVLLDARPGLTAVVFDQPDVVAGDHPRVEGRLDWRAGDFFDADTGELPAGADLYLLSHVLHDWADADAARIVGRVAEAMGPRSRLIVVENVPADELNLLVCYLDVLMLTAFGSRERTVAEHAALLDKAGLRLVDDRTLIPATGLRALVAAPAG